MPYDTLSPEAIAPPGTSTANTFDTLSPPVAPASAATKDYILNRVPDQWGLRANLGATGDFLLETKEGTARLMANVMGVPIDTLRGFINKHAGDGTQDPNEAYNAIVKDMESAGAIHPNAKLYNDFAANLGPDLLADALLLTPLGALGKVTEATTLAGKGLDILRGMGEAARANPAATAITGVGASLGATEAQHLYPDSPVAPFIGAGVGGAAFRRVPYLSSNRALARAEVEKFPAIDPRADPSLVSQFARNYVNNSKEAINTQINQIVQEAATQMQGTSRVGRSGNSVRDAVSAARGSARWLRTQGRFAEIAADERQTQVWDGTGKGRVIDIRPLKQAASTIQADTEMAPTHAPQQIIKRILALPDQAQLGDIMGSGSVRSDLLRMLRASDGGDAGIIRDNLNTLQTAALDNVKIQFPNDPALAEATNFSKWYNDKFWRKNSPFRVFMETSSGEKDAGPALIKFIARQNSGEDIVDITNELSRQELIPAAEQALKDEFTSQVALGDVKKASKFMRTKAMIQFMTDVPRLSASLQQTSFDLGDLLTKKKTIGEGLFAKMGLSGGKDLRSTIAGIMTSGDKAAQLQQIMDGIPKVPEARLARSAIQREVLDQLEAQAGGNPLAFKNAMDNNREIGRVLNVAFPDPKQMQRVTRIINDAAILAKGGVAAKGPIKAITSVPVTFLSNWLGARAGATIGQGGASLLMAGRVSRFWRGMAEKYFANIEPHMSIGMMATDRNFEKLVHASIPQNRADAAAFLRLNQAALSALTGELHDNTDSIGRVGVSPEMLLPKDMTAISR